MLMEKYKSLKELLGEHVRLVVYDNQIQVIMGSGNTHKVQYNDKTIKIMSDIKVSKETIDKIIEILH